MEVARRGRRGVRTRNGVPEEVRDLAQATVPGRCFRFEHARRAWARFVGEQPTVGLRGPGRRWVRARARSCWEEETCFVHEQ